MLDYSELLIKKYKYWKVQVHENQGYLGRCVIWCERDDALDLADVTQEEYGELLLIIKSLKAATEKLFDADWFNYAFLGNEVQHLHCHFVPRYRKDIAFEGMVFRDSLWGHNWKTDPQFLTHPDILQKIKVQFKDALR